MADATTFRNAMSNSTTLVQRDQYDEALRIVDDAIADATTSEEKRWVRILCHHAAVIATFKEDLELAKHYYEQSLACNPENSRALYGLATISREQGNLEGAKQYAARCYQTLSQDDEDFLRDGLMELLLKNWPEVAQK